MIGIHAGRFPVLSLTLIHGDSSVPASEAFSFSIDTYIFSHNFDSVAGDERRVHAVAIFIDNDTDGCVELREIPVVAHEAVGVSTMAYVTSQEGGWRQMGVVSLVDILDHQTSSILEMTIGPASVEGIPVLHNV